MGQGGNMKFIRLIPTLACIICCWIMQSHYNLSITSSLLIMIFPFEFGYAVNRIPLKFPEDEAAPYFQFQLSKITIVLLTIIFAIGTVTLFNSGEFDKCAYFFWIYFNIISGYFSSVFDKA